VYQLSCLMHQFAAQVSKHVRLDLLNYEALHAWSVKCPEEFWKEVWSFMEVRGEQGDNISSDLHEMIHAKFFPNGCLNFAENCLRKRGKEPAIIFTQENATETIVTWDELRERVCKLSSSLRLRGLRKGDRVCAVVANTPEAVICMLATVSVGAVWSSVSPDFGSEGILERFCQIQPKLFFHTDQYYNKNRLYDVSHRIREVEEGLRKHLPSDADDLVSVSIDAAALETFCKDAVTSKELVFEKTNFNDPLFIMFSSGTTGKPKCIIHRHGVLLQLMKEHQLHSNIQKGDRVFYYTTTTWMMWNWLVGVLASEATILLYEGNPFYPDSNSLFQFASRSRCTFFGVSAKYIDSLKSAPEFKSPPEQIESIRTIASTGSPLVPESFDFIYDRIKGDVNVASICGGTDIISCFILGCPIKPVKRGFSQCRGLGMDVQVWDPDTGKPTVNQKGELVCCTPFPSQPIGFWGDDASKTRYKEAYFGEFENVWKHGDFCLIDQDGHVFVYGRSDATLKPGGVRIGTAEIYRSVESLPFVKESICCGIELKLGEESVALFVTLRETSGILTEAMRDEIRKAVVKSATRHHVPKIIEQVSDIPRTKSGKIVELAVKNILHQLPVKNLNALANPEALKEYERFAVNRA
jgi:acetoacetyl-CoA synthetase